MNSENSTSTSTVLLALLGGAIIGAGVALLYSPQAGSRTRKKLRDLADDGEEYAREFMDKAEEGLESVERKAEKGLARAERKAEEWMLKGRQLVEDTKRQVAASLDGGKATH